MFFVCRTITIREQNVTKNWLIFNIIEVCCNFEVNFLFFITNFLSTMDFIVFKYIWWIRCILVLLFIDLLKSSYDWNYYIEVNINFKQIRNVYRELSALQKIVVVEIRGIPQKILNSFSFLLWWMWNHNWSRVQPCCVRSKIGQQNSPSYAEGEIFQHEFI